jgi:hypothetical protein
MNGKSSHIPAPGYVATCPACARTCAVYWDGPTLHSICCLLPVNIRSCRQIPQNSAKRGPLGAK